MPGSFETDHSFAVLYLEEEVVEEAEEGEGLVELHLYKSVFDYDLSQDHSTLLLYVSRRRSRRIEKYFLRTTYRAAKDSRQ